MNINPSTIRDAAQVDSANYRGCRWKAREYTAGRGGGLYSQIVGHKMSLDEYKRYMRSLRWQADRTVHGRILAVAAESDNCAAVFASERAIVVTIATSTNPSPGNVLECDRAVAFASLAISKAP